MRLPVFGLTRLLTPRRFLLVFTAVWVATLPLFVPAKADGDCGTFLLTAYDKEEFPGYTADGTLTADLADAVAASPDVPMGAHVSVDGLGEYTVHDRGSGLRWRHLDLLLETHQEAIEFGVQRAWACWEE